MLHCIIYRIFLKIFDGVCYFLSIYKCNTFIFCKTFSILLLAHILFLILIFSFLFQIKFPYTEFSSYILHSSHHLTNSLHLFSWLYLSLLCSYFVFQTGFFIFLLLYYASFCLRRWGWEGGSIFCMVIMPFFSSCNS